MADEQKLPQAPKDFFNLPPDQQNQYLEAPGTLPSDLPQRAGRLGLEALPYAGATAAAIATEGLAVPWWLGLLARGAMAGIGGAGGEAVKQEAYRGFKMPEAADTRPEELKRIVQQGRQQAEAELAGGLVLKPIEMGAKAWLNPERVYKSAIHPPGISDEEVANMLQTGIKYRIKPNAEGRQLAVNFAKSFNTQIDKRIASNPVDVPPQKWTANLKDRFDKLRADWGSTARSGKANEEALDAIEKDFLINHGQVKPLMRWDPKKQTFITVRKVEDMGLPELRQRARPISASRMQQIKKSTWKAIRAEVNPKGLATRFPGFSPGTNVGLEMDADEEMGRMLREELGNQYPGMHDVNREEGAMFELKSAIDRELLNQGRKRLFPYWLGPAAALTAEGGRFAGSPWGHAGELIGGMTGAALPFARGVLETPMSKARIAFGGEYLSRGGLGPGLARGSLREIPAGAGRAFQYMTDTGPATSPGQEPTIEIDPKDFQPAAPAAAPAAPPRAANRPPLKPMDQAVLERERQMNINPTPGWSTEYAQMLTDASQRLGVPLSLLHAVSAQEGSNGNPLARSPKNAVGLMQVMPDTGRQFGYSEKDLEDPRKNIDASARVLKYLLGRPQLQNNPALVLAAYNAGEGAVKKADYKVYNMPDETKKYVTKALQAWSTLGLPAGQSEIIRSTIPER